MIQKTQNEIMKDWNSSDISIPLLSISCITYNHALYIEQCLDGMLMQKTNFPFEILIHDDCSTDGTTEIIKKYAEQFPQIIKPMFENENQYQNGKPSGSKIWNFPRAKGKYMAMCEGDDYWTDDQKIQKQVDFLETNSDYSLICHNALLISNNENAGLFNKKNLQEELTASELVLNWCIPTASMIFRKEVCDIIPTIDGLIQGDILMYLSAISIGRCHYDNTVMSAYRINNTNSVSSGFSRDYFSYYQNMKKSIKKIDECFKGMFHKPIKKLQRKYTFYIFRFGIEKYVPCIFQLKKLLKKILKKCKH